MQIKAAVRYLSTSMRMTKTQGTDNTEWWQECRTTETLIHIDKNATGTLLWKTVFHKVKHMYT